MKEIVDYALPMPHICVPAVCEGNRHERVIIPLVGAESLTKPMSEVSKFRNFGAFLGGLKSSASESTASKHFGGIVNLSAEKTLVKTKEYPGSSWSREERTEVRMRRSLVFRQLRKSTPGYSHMTYIIFLALYIRSRWYDLGYKTNYVYNPASNPKTDDPGP